MAEHVAGGTGEWRWPAIGAPAAKLRGRGEGEHRGEHSRGGSLTGGGPDGAGGVCPMTAAELHRGEQEW